LKPDEDKTTYTMLVTENKTPPRIIFGTTALKWVQAMVDVHPHEIGFYGIVDERPDYTFFIRDIFYPKNSEANSATCEISTDGSGDLARWLINHNREEDVSKVSFWAHSHHTMGTSPSGQDEKQAMDRMRITQSFLIRAICNKAGEVSISFFDYDNKIKFDHIKWEVEEDTDGSYHDGKINEISNIVFDDAVVSSEKLKEIHKVLHKDDQYDKIKKKVTELKEINMPSPKIDYNNKTRSGFVDNEEYYNSFYNKKRGGRNQSDIFGDVNFENDKKELDDGFSSNIDKEDFFDRKEIDDMIERYEERIGIEGD